MNLSVSDICSDLEKELGVRFSPEVKATIGHLAVKKTVLAAEDLEAFAQHGKRTNVTAEDVKLLTRRNPNLKTYLSSLQREVTSRISSGVKGSKHVKSVKKKKNIDNEEARSASASRCGAFVID